MTVTLVWDANVESDLAGYRVYHGHVAGQYFESVLVLAPTNTKVWSGLYDWLPHVFAVSAYDTTGNEGAKSNVISKQIYLLKDTVLLQGAVCD